MNDNEGSAITPGVEYNKARVLLSIVKKTAQDAAQGSLRALDRAGAGNVEAQRPKRILAVDCLA
jgi:hypothetical protein